VDVIVKSETALLGPGEARFSGAALSALPDARVVGERALDLGTGERLGCLPGSREQVLGARIRPALDDGVDPAVHVETGPQHAFGLVWAHRVEDA
jgi:hypothetical protein